MKEIQNLIWQAKFEKKSNWIKAVKLLQDYIKEEPNNKQVLAELAEIFLEKKLYKKGIEYYQKILQLTPSNSNALFKIANSYLTLGEHKIALNYYDKIQDYFPESMYNKAIALNRMGKNNESIEILEKLVSSTPTTQLPYFFLIEQYLSKKNYRNAIKYLDIVEKRFGKQGKVFFLRGLSYSNLSNWLHAFVEFQDAQKMKYRTASFYRAFGIACEKIGKTDEAIEKMMESIKIEPFNTFTYVDLINIFLSHDRIIEAFEIAEQAKKISPLSSSISMLYHKIAAKIEEDKKKK